MSTPMAPAPRQALAEAAPPPAQNGDRMAALGRALARETQAVHELREALVRQRDGVARDSIPTVHGSCDDIGRLLVTLDSSRRHRTALLAELVPGPDPTLDALASAMGTSFPAELSEARVALRREAEAAAREAAVNRVVLQRTVEAGEAFLQALFAGAGGQDPVYRLGEKRDDDGSGHLLDRKA